MAVITISRGSASGGLLLAEGVARELGYRVVSREDVVQEAAHFGVPEEKLKEALSSPPRFWERVRSDRRRYLAFVQAALADRAQEDRIVYHGNAGHFLLCCLPNVLRVRLIAPLDFRVKMLMERENMSRSEAIEYIENVDRERASWTRFLYGVDPLDPHLYDLVINLEVLDVDAAVQMVVAAAKHPRLETNEESRRAMADLVLASKVRAALAANVETASLDIEVESKDGVVLLKGRVPHPSLVQSAVRVAEAVEGVKRVTRDYIDAPDFTV